MNSATRLLASWDFRPAVILVLSLSGGLYLAGWLRLRRRGGRRLATGWRLASFFSGLLVLAVALMSAVDLLSSFLFFVHMIQHLLLASVAPVLLLLGNPFPFIMWGLPRRWRVGHALFSRQAPVRHILQRFTPQGILVMLFIIFLWGWHDPNAYSAALRIPWLHDIEHLTFFIPAMLLWWRAVNVAPHLHGRTSALARVALLLATAAANMIAGVAIAMSRTPIYSYYQGVPRLWGISVMQDQMISGVIMWIPGTMMYFVAILAILGRKLSEENEGRDEERSRYLTEANMSMP